MEVYLWGIFGAEGCGFGGAGEGFLTVALCGLVGFGGGWLGMVGFLGARVG